MKGIVFSEFLDFVGAQFGDDMVDDIIEASALPSGGAYTAVGTYDHGEIVALVGALAARSGQDAGKLAQAFGAHLAGVFERGYPEFFARSTHFFDFLESVEAHIHHEVRKLYPDAELPSFTVAERGPTRMVLDYRSPRRMGALAVGLIEGTARHFGVNARVRSEPLDATGESLRFTVQID